MSGGQTKTTRDSDGFNKLVSFLNGHSLPLDFFASLRFVFLQGAVSASPRLVLHRMPTHERTDFLFSASPGSLQGLLGTVCRKCLFLTLVFILSFNISAMEKNKKNKNLHNYSRIYLILFSSQY
jgi:hypothetical protein